MEACVKMFKLLYLLLIPVLLLGRGYESPENRSQAKNLLKMIHLDYKITALNHCQYDYDKTSCMDKTEVNTSTCAMSETDQTILWIQVVPDTFFGRNFRCMTETPCIDEFTKKPFGSPMCCRRIDSNYKKIEADLYNLIPVTSKLKELRHQKLFGEVEKIVQTVGETKVGEKVIEPPAHAQGDIARVYLYMNKQYGLGLTLQQKEMFEKWHRLDEVSAQECSVAKIIKKVQGHSNPWIEEGCKNIRAVQNRLSSPLW